MLHNPNQPYMMYSPMMDQGFQWQSQYGQGNQSVDSARASKSHGHSKSSSSDKDPKKNIRMSKGPAQFPQAAMNQFVPVYMMPPGFSGHPGAFNAALAAHNAQQSNGTPQLQNNSPAAAYQMPTYGHNFYGQPYGFGPYGYPTQQQKGYYNPSAGYSGSDYASGHESSRNSKSSDSGSKRTSRSMTSKDSGHGQVIKPTIKKNVNVKKFQSTHQITIQKGPKKTTFQNQVSCGRSHSSGSELSAGCSASNCPPGAPQARACSHDSDNSNSVSVSVAPAISNERKFSNNVEFKKPDGDLTDKLTELIEFYLSDEYLAKDKYLLRQIRCKSEGYISIKLMTSFKKVKKLTKDWRTVRHALLASPNLIVSPEGFRVKRATQLPENLRKPRLLSSVVTIRLTEEFSSVDAITNMFSKYGEIGLVRILKPGKEIPSDLRNYATQVPDIGKTMCAVVDFEQSESALQAVRCLKDDLVEQKMRLALLGPRVRRTLYKQDRGDDEDGDEPLNIEEAVNVEPEADNSFKAKLVANSSNDSSTSSDKSTTSIDLSSSSVDSGNQHSADEDVDIVKGINSIVLNNDNSNHMIKAQKVITLNKNAINMTGKITSIFREPEGPGSNPANGFAFKRSF